MTAATPRTPAAPVGAASGDPLPLPVRRRGLGLIEDPLLNKGTAFPREEREALGLAGLLPPHVMTMEEQLARVGENYERKGLDIERYIFLASLHDRNETLFYRFLLERLEALLPIVYTPTVGEACQRWSHIYRRPRGLYVTPEDEGRIGALLENLPPRPVRVIVVTDSERILGLGDLGAGGIGIPIGKLAIYTVAAGIAPEHCLPVCLDVGTNNAGLLSDPLYLGVRRERLRGEVYDRLVDEFVLAAVRKWPNVLIQWEDFATENAFRLLDRYRDRVLSFNDDIQGTGAVALAGILAAVRLAGERMADQRVVFLGAGEAASGTAAQIVAAMVADGLPEAEARRQIWLCDRQGLVHRGRGALAPQKALYAREAAEAAAIAGASAATAAPVPLLDVVRHVRPTVLLGTSGTPATFTEEIVRAMAAGTPRPIILPLSNPTSKAECSPAQAYAWTDGRCLVATGSPFAPVEWKGARRRVGQANNAFIFPGVGLGTLVSEARRVTDGMFRVAARALGDLIRPADLAEGALYPPIARIREASRAVAAAVAREAIRSGVAVAALAEAEVEARVDDAMWTPAYRPYTAA